MFDAIQAIVTARTAFIRQNLAPPAVIELRSFEEGCKFYNSLRSLPLDRQASYGVSHQLQPVEVDGGLLTQVQVMGVWVRWPGKRWMNPDGSVTIG